MELFYTSTRDPGVHVSASKAILRGLSEDGGLFVPERFPALSISYEAMADMTYQELAFEVMRLFLTDFSEDELRECICSAYDSKFDDPQIAPLAQAAGNWYLELFHGKTIAFKDMALSILPYLMTTAARKNKVDHEIVILTATSGDTGKAALAGFADVPGTKIVVYYPKHGVRAIQEKQMITQKGDNTFVVGIEGNFDQAQTGVKTMFSDRVLREEMHQANLQFSSANSINIGRLVPQIVYYVHAYCRLIKNGAIRPGDKINVTVPTGNFGNILAAWYAKQMGLPIGRLICASNENKVLFDFFQNGIYDRNRPFLLTSSPSMDILISSNLERLLYHICGNDADETARRMRDLSKKGRYEISEPMRAELACFTGGFATQQETAEEIARVKNESGYILDTHTAVASCVWRKYREQKKNPRVNVIVSTASPFKFTRSVLEAIGENTDGADDFVLADKLSDLSGIPVPPAVEEIRNAPIRHQTVVPPEQMEQALKNFLGLN